MASAHKLRGVRLTVLALACSVAAVATAQTQPQAPNMPNPKTTVPEKIDPPLNSGKSTDSDTTGTVRGGTLSDQLNKSDGVITPPTNMDQGIHAPAPVPNPGTMPVIPPPNGSNSTIDPK